LTRRVSFLLIAIAAIVLFLSAGPCLASGKKPADVGNKPPAAEEDATAPVKEAPKPQAGETEKTGPKEAAKASPAVPGPEISELAPGVWAFVGENGSTNSGFVVTSEGVVVIDSQGPAQRARLLKDKIKEVTDRPVVYVINTHYHGDHTFGNQYFPGAIIVAQANTRALLVERDEGHRERFKKFFGPDSLDGFVLTLPTLTFADSITIRSGGTEIVVKYIGYPAHTTGDAFVYLPGQKVLFAGDLLYNGRLPLLDDGDSSGAIAALDTLEKTGAEKFVPGHGPISGPEGVAAYRGYLVELRGEVRWLKKKGMTIDQVRDGIKLPRYSDYLNYDKWLPANAAKVYRELEEK